MTKKLNWDRLKFTPIKKKKKDTLQEEIDYFISEVKEIDEMIATSENAIKSEIDVMRHEYMFKKIAENQLRDLEFQHYLRTGKFNN